MDNATNNKQQTDYESPFDDCLGKSLADLEALINKTEVNIDWLESEVYSLEESINASFKGIEQIMKKADESMSPNKPIETSLISIGISDTGIDIASAEAK